MFNAAQKEDYLQQNEGRNVSLRNTAGSIFNSTEKYEEENNKDAAEWTVAEIISYYKSLATSSFVGLLNRHSQLRKYADWCLDNNMIKDSQNHYAEIDTPTLRGCLNVGLLKNGILTRKEMETEISQLLNPREQCLVYALFEGIQGREFSELTELNMDQVRGTTLSLANRKIKVHPKLIELMKESTDEYTYYTYGDKQRQYPFDTSDTNVFKKTYNSKQDSQARKRQRLYSALTPEGLFRESCDQCGVAYGKWQN